MYENQTEQIIKQRMLDSIPSDIDKSEGSFTFDAIAPAALEIAQTYIELDGILQKAFAQTSYGEWLDKRAAEFGMYRKPGARARGQVTLSGVDSTGIPAGTLVQTDGGLQYAVTAEAVIDGGSADADVEALEEGEKYDIHANVSMELPVQLAGITGVTSRDINGGSYAETDEALLQRLLTKVRYPATSGNIYHYRQWALEVQGVGDAKVFPLWHGPGTVKISIVDSSKLPPSIESTLAADVETYINNVRPVCVSVSVENAVAVNVDIFAIIKLAETYDENAADAITQEFQAKLAAYFRDIAFASDYVSYARIGSILLDIPDVLDYMDLTVNGDMANLSLQPHEVPVLGNVVLTTQRPV